MFLRDHSSFMPIHYLNRHKIIPRYYLGSARSWYATVNLNKNQTIDLQSAASETFSVPELTSLQTQQGNLNIIIDSYHCWVCVQFLAFWFDMALQVLSDGVGLPSSSFDPAEEPSLPHSCLCSLSLVCWHSPNDDAQMNPPGPSKCPMRQRADISKASVWCLLWACHPASLLTNKIINSLFSIRNHCWSFMLLRSNDALA